MFGLNKQRTQLLLEIIELAKEPEVRAYLCKHESKILALFKDVKSEKSDMPKWIEALCDSMLQTKNRKSANQ